MTKDATKTKQKPGRKPLKPGEIKSPAISLRVTPEQHAKFIELGGASAIKAFLDGHMTAPEPSWLSEVRDLKHALEDVRGKLK